MGNIGNISPANIKDARTRPQASSLAVGHASGRAMAHRRPQEGGTPKPSHKYSLAIALALAHEARPRSAPPLLLPNSNPSQHWQPPRSQLSRTQLYY